MKYLRPDPDAKNYFASLSGKMKLIHPDPDPHCYILYIIIRSTPARRRWSRGIRPLSGASGGWYPSGPSSWARACTHTHQSKNIQTKTTETNYAYCIIYKILKSNRCFWHFTLPSRVLDSHLFSCGFSLKIQKEMAKKRGLNENFTNLITKGTFYCLNQI